MIWICAIIAIIVIPVFPEGPGLPSITFEEADLFKPLGTIEPESEKTYDDGKYGNGYTTLLLDGYLVTPIRKRKSGFYFWDISDPYNPKMAGEDTDVDDIREPHAIALSKRGEKTFAATLEEHGVNIRDWSDMKNPRIVKEVNLQGIPNADYSGSWWLSWQGRYLYVAGGDEGGLYIVDTKEIENSEQVGHVHSGNEGLKNPGGVFAIGNHLYIHSNSGGSNIFTYDISDPLKPELLFSPKSHNLYSMMVNGGKIYTAGNKKMQVFDISDPSVITLDWEVDTEAEGSKGGYLVIQDDFVHLGNSSHYLKISLKEKKSVGKSYFNEPKSDMDFVQVIGNMYTIGCDHGYGIKLFAHQTVPDTKAPIVNMVDPPDGAAFQAVTTRIGLTFSDQVDFSTVGEETVVIQTEDGEKVEGFYALQTGIVNFSPSNELQPGKTYEVRVRGIKDYSGNEMQETFVSRFSTGSTVTITKNKAEPGGDGKSKPSVLQIFPKRETHVPDAIGRK